MSDTVELKNLRNMKSSESSSSDNSKLSNPNSISSNSKIHQIRPSMFLIAVACTCALTAFHFGYAISSINVPAKVFRKCDPIRTGFFNCFTISKSAWGLVGMGLPLGGWIGGSLAPTVINKFGSLKRAILFLNIPLIFAYLFMSLAINLPMLIIGRCLLGFSSGASGMMVPLYLSSITPLQFRGVFTNFFQLFLCSGIFIAEIISYSANLGQHPWHWRFSFAAGIPVIALQFFLAKFLGLFPDTPRDLESSNQGDVAIFLRNKLGIREETVSVDFKDSDSSVPEVPVSSQGTLLELITFRIPSASKSLALGMIFHAGQQISGVNAIFFYSESIVGDFLWTPVLLAFINLSMTVVAIWLLNHAGRRPVALFSIAGSASNLIALSGSFFLLPSMAPFFLVAFVFCFSLGLGPIPWMLTPEIFPSAWPLTPVAISICVAANWITNIIVTGTFPWLSEIFKMEWIFLAFGASCSILFIYIYQWLPETKNRQPNFI